MRPLKLIMQAFGPYAGKEEIDFQQLGNRTMFVISGKTGSGKTTIFDGISFAIYGKASGEDRGGADLRSQFAAEELQTEVSLEFSLRNKNYYIWRAPQQDKKKSRGDGYTSVGAKAELYVINDDGTKKIIASNVRETDEKIKEIVQLDANQFRQILMIPQGEFRKLLTSESKDKEMILQKLFHTELYKRVEESLKEEASILKKVVETKVNERSQHLKNIYYSENEELKELLLEENPNDIKILPLLDDQIHLMNETLKETTEHYEKTKVKRDDAKRKVDEASVLMKQFEEREMLNRSKGILESKQEEMKAKQKEIEDAYKAIKLEQQDSLCHRLRKEYDEYKQQLMDLEKNIEIITKKQNDAEKQYMMQEEKKEERERVTEEITNLLNLKEEIYSIEMRKIEVNELAESKQNLEKKIHTTQQKIVDISERLTKIKKSIKHLEEVRLQAFENEKERMIWTDNINKLKKVHSIIEENKRIEKKYSQSQQLYERTNNRLKDLKSTVAVLEEKWQKGQASILAAKLIDSNPCPVCGANHHPNPAKHSDQIPTENELKSARHDVEKLEKEKLAEESAWLEAKSRFSAAEATLNDNLEDIIKNIPDFSLENLTLITSQYIDKQKNLEETLREQKKNIDLLPQLEKELGFLELQEKDEKNKLDGLLLQEREVTSQYIEMKTAFEQIVKKIPLEIRSIHHFEQKLKRAQTIKHQLEEALENARSDWQKTKEQLSGLNASYQQLNILVENTGIKLQTERDEFKSMLDENGFASYQHFAQSKRTQVQIKHLEDVVQTYREDYRSVSDRLNDMNERLKSIAQPDLDVLQYQFTQLEEEIAMLSDKLTTIKMNIVQNESIKTRVNNINDEIKNIEEQFQLIGHLSEVAKGQNTYRVTFERFVLASFLDDILLVANTRLTKMTSGRYSLLRKTDRSKGNVQSGLELLIFDQYTGQERHVKTLSGGESFKAALALALGLADVVQQYAGGVSLETMFIDEGFGTLDPESLDHAIEALMDVQNSGRLVGIISHVPELKERIDARLEVIASQNGSYTEFQFLG